MAERLSGYHAGRNTPGQDLTSMLSPHLHWGELSPAQLWYQANEVGSGEGLDTYHTELLWHEFSVNLLWRNPTMPDAPQRADFARLPWRDDPAGLRAWERGRTGVPIVDAGMRQLWHIGWMHNRVRMITASFLVKHLLVSWVEGERWFWDTLVDGDLAVNAQSWQWIAGCGTDSAPFFRVFNPVTQGEKFDPAGDYVRKWVPELAALPSKWLHAPWTAPQAVLDKAGVALGRTYPHPVVALEEGRGPCAGGVPCHAAGGMIIPPNQKLRVVGDVHGDSRAFAFATDTDRFVVQLGDLTDSGPDSAGTLALALRLLDEGRGVFLLGNHDRKLGRALSGQPVRVDPALEETLAQLPTSLRARAPGGDHARAGLDRGWKPRVRAWRLPHGHAGPRPAPGARPGGHAAEPGAVRADHGGGCRRTAIRSACYAGWTASPRASPCIAATTDAAPMGGPTCTGAAPGDVRCSWTRAPARAATCRGSTCRRARRDWR